MSTTQAETGRPTSFFASLPGVLTAVAAVITAVGGVYGVWWTSRDSSPPVPVVDPTTVATPSPTSDPTVDPVPTPADTMSDADVALLLAALLASEGDGGASEQTSEQASESETTLVDWYVQTDDAGRAAIELCVAGDTAACEQTWYLLLDECGSSYGAACDAVFWLSPFGSQEEYFGATCGGLLADESMAGECA